LSTSSTGLADRGIGFRSLQEAIDTTTPGGKLVFHGGRPSVMTAHKARVAQEMYRSGQSTVAAIATPLA
jgi:hypothetical protein